VFSVLISATSPSGSSKSKMSKFSLTQDGVTDFGNTMSPRSMWQRSTTCLLASSRSRDAAV
jgi:hypothetical protein